MANYSSNFPIVALKVYDIVEKTIHYIQINHVIDKTKIKSAEVQENLNKAQFNLLIHSKTLTHKTSVDPELLQRRICVRKKQKEKTPKEFYPVFNKITERLGLLFAVDRIVSPDELKRTVVGALHIGRPGSTKTFAGSSIFWRSGMKKDIENRGTTCTTCMSSGKNIKHQWPSTEKKHPTGIDWTRAKDTNWLLRQVT